MIRQLTIRSHSLARGPRERVAGGHRGLLDHQGYTLHEEGSAEKDGLIWRIYRAKAECGENVLVQLLAEDGSLIDQRTEEAHCVRGDPEEDGSGESMIWSASIDSDEGRPTRYVMFTFGM